MQQTTTLIAIFLSAACSTMHAPSTVASSCITGGDDVESGYTWAIHLTVEEGPLDPSRRDWGFTHADSNDVHLVRDNKLCERAIETMAAKGYRKGKRVVLFRVRDIFVGKFAGEGDNAWVLDRQLRPLATFIVPS